MKATTRSILLKISDWGEERIVSFKLPPRGGVNDGGSVEDAPSHLHLFSFPSGTRKEEVKINNIQKNPLLITLTVAMTYDFPEAPWLAERLEDKGCVVVFVSASFDDQGLTRSYDFACPTKLRGGAYSVGGGALCRLRGRSPKGEVGANCEEM